MSLQDVRERAHEARVARQIADAAQEDYLAAVRAAMAAGCSVPEIAAAAGVTRTAVYQALRRRGPKPVAVSAAERTASRHAVRMLEYRAAREADLRAAEARTGGYAGDVAHERAQGVRQPITFKQWLQQGAAS